MPIVYYLGMTIRRISGSDSDLDSYKKNTDFPRIADFRILIADFRIRIADFNNIFNDLFINKNYVLNFTFLVLSA